LALAEALRASALGQPQVGPPPSNRRPSQHHRHGMAVVQPSASPVARVHACGLHPQLYPPRPEGEAATAGGGWDTTWWFSGAAPGSVAAPVEDGRVLDQQEAPAAQCAADQHHAVPVAHVEGEGPAAAPVQAGLARGGSGQMKRLAVSRRGRLRRTRRVTTCPWMRPPTPPPSRAPRPGRRRSQAWTSAVAPPAHPRRKPQTPQSPPSSSDAQYCQWARLRTVANRQSRQRSARGSAANSGMA